MKEQNTVRSESGHATGAQGGVVCVVDGARHACLQLIKTKER